MLSLSRLCTRPDGTVTRRDFLRVGGLGTAGLSLAGFLQARTLPLSPGGERGRGEGAFGKAKSCIVLFLDGGAPHQDTFDLKPDAPAELRGEFKPIATNVPGIQVCELFPQIARHADKFALIRSVHVGSDIHEVGTYAMLTGTKFKGVVIADKTKETPEDTPSIGSVMSRLRSVPLSPRRERGRGEGALPPYVWMPFIWKGYPIIAQGYGGFLGRTYDPFRILEDPNAPAFQVEALALPREVSLDRLAERRGLLDSFNRQTEKFLRSGSASRISAHYQRALDMIASPLARKAFDLSAEDAKVRDRYGRHTFGQSVLLARRLVEHGVALVTVYWHDYKHKDPGMTNWDTHGKNYPALKQSLMPPTDQAYSALLEDLADRGLLDDTLVVLMGDFGRTPKINGGGGRDHWGGCCSLLFAGAGIRTGQVLGSSDKTAAYPRDFPVTPGDVVATMYHCLGVDPHLELPDQFGRPLRVCLGDPIRPVLA